MNDKAFTFGEATLCVQRETVGTRLAAQRVEAVLVDTRPDALYWAVSEFARFVASTTVTEGALAFDIPAGSADRDTITAAFDDWMSQDTALIDDWQATYKDLHTAKKATPPTS